MGWLSIFSLKWKWKVQETEESLELKEKLDKLIKKSRNERLFPCETREEINETGISCFNYLFWNINYKSILDYLLENMKANKLLKILNSVSVNSLSLLFSKEELNNLVSFLNMTKVELLEASINERYLDD